MKFSIIVPIFKVEKYLNECIDSVLAQSFKDYEIILVDDGSPDSCPQICDEYASRDNRIKVIHQKNAGLACARNSGIRVASGEYIICIDSDDYIVNESFLKKVADKTENKSDIILYGFQKYYESNQSFGMKDIPIIDGQVSVEKMFSILLPSDSMSATAWTKAIRNDLLKSNGIEFREGMISEDIDWYLHVLVYAKTIESLNEIGIIYRQRPGSISHDSKINSLEDNIWILEHWSEFVNAEISDESLRIGFYKALARYFGNCLILYSGYAKNIRHAYRKKLKNMNYLLDYAITPRSRTIQTIYKSVGFDFTVAFLRLLARLKRRQ